MILRWSPGVFSSPDTGPCHRGICMIPKRSPVLREDVDAAGATGSPPCHEEVSLRLEDKPDLIRATLACNPSLGGAWHPGWEEADGGGDHHPVFTIQGMFRRIHLCFAGRPRLHFLELIREIPDDAAFHRQCVLSNVHREWGWSLQCFLQDEAIVARECDLAAASQTDTADALIE